MPNWCDNILYVRGTAKDLNEFLTKFKGKPALYAPNKYEIEGKTEEEIAELLKKAKEEHDKLEPRYCFNALYPVPEEVLKVGFDGSWRYRKGEEHPEKNLTKQIVDRLTDISDGYGWQSNKWGTKWDIYWDVVCCSGEDLIKEAIENGEEDADTEIVFSFSTAWSPPEGFVLKVAKDFPNLEFELLYFEPGMCFAGLTKVKGEKILEQIDYNNDTMLMIMFVRENFDEDYGRQCEKCGCHIHDCECDSNNKDEEEATVNNEE